MRKKDTLYKANKWNQPLFMPDENIFDGGGDIWNNLAFKKDPAGSMVLGMQGFDPGSIYKKTKNWLGITKEANPFSKGNLKTVFSSDAFKGAADGLLSAGTTMVGSAIGNAISGGLESGAGSFVSGLGDIAQNIPVYGKFAGPALKIAAGGINALIGKSVDAEKKAANDAGTRQLNSVSYSASTTDELAKQQAAVTGVANVQDAHRGGALTGSWADDMNQKDWDSRESAMLFADRSLKNAAGNILSNDINNELANYSAYGGPLGAVELDLAYDALNVKRKNAQNKDKMTNLFMSTPSLFAFGGDMETNGSDFSTGLMHIDAGGSHSENPNDGVQLGVDSQNVPNLVEENETVFNDYVYSARINLDTQAKEKFHFPKKKDITYAEATKKLEKEIAERPNDPISKASFKAQMETLANEQERQKQEMGAERAKAAFEALSPEEQTAIMQKAAQEEAMAQEAMAQQQVAAQNAAQVNPEEAAMAQQQMMQADGSQAVLGAEPDLAQLQANVSALGGELVRAGDVNPEANVFAVGGRKARKVAKKYSKDWFLNQAKSLGLVSDDATELTGFKFDENDPTANLTNFNNIYRQYQRDKALKTYREGQRQSKKNKLFGDGKPYRMSDDGTQIYKARINDKARIGWQNADGDFKTQEEYNKLSKEEKETYRRVNEKAGDYMYDYNGHRLEDVDNRTQDEILDQFSPDYEKNFKWDDKDAQALQYPVEMEHSGLSNLRYVPGLAGAIGLGYDLLNPADYSRAEAIQNIGSYAPNTVTPNYRGNYLKYEPVDPWFWEAPILANSRASARAIQNSGANQGAKNAAQLGLDYNTNIALGQAGLNGQIQNFERKYKTTAFNNDLDKAYMNLDMQAQMANQKALLDAAENNSKYRYIGLSMMDDIDARKNASINANLTNLMTSIGNIGEEAYDEDSLKWLEKTGVLKSNYFGNVACNGGKIKRSKLKL